MKNAQCWNQFKVVKSPVKDVAASEENFEVCIDAEPIGKDTIMLPQCITLDELVRTLHALNNNMLPGSKVSIALANEARDACLIRRLAVEKPEEKKEHKSHKSKDEKHVSRKHVPKPVVVEQKPQESESSSTGSEEVEGPIDAELQGADDNKTPVIEQPKEEPKPEVKPEAKEEPKKHRSHKHEK